MKKTDFHNVIYFLLIFSLLRRGSMFILSEEQFKWLLTLGGFNVNRLAATNNEISILGNLKILKFYENEIHISTQSYQMHSK